MTPVRADLHRTGGETLDRSLGRGIRAVGAGLALVAAVGCGIGDAVFNACGQQESAYEWSQRKRDGMKARGVDPRTGTYRLAEKNVDAARERLVECRAQS